MSWVCMRRIEYYGLWGKTWAILRSHLPTNISPFIYEDSSSSKLSARLTDWLFTIRVVSEHPNPSLRLVSNSIASHWTFPVKCCMKRASNSSYNFIPRNHVLQGMTTPHNLLVASGLVESGPRRELEGRITLLCESSLIQSGCPKPHSNACETLI